MTDAARHHGGQREAAARESGKLAALGQLTRGAAHEINNLLQPALGLPALVRERLPVDDAESREDLDCVLDAVRKVSRLVRDIGSFAQPGEPARAPLELCRELRATVGFVGGLIRPPVLVRECGLEAFAGCLVTASKTELIELITHLLLQAAPAPTGRASVTITVGRVEPSAEQAARLSIAPARPCLTVTVTGDGSRMAAATGARLVEPPVATWPANHETAHSLAAVHDIVRCWGGGISVDAAPGAGATVTLYLPIVAE